MICLLCQSLPIIMSVTQRFLFCPCVLCTLFSHIKVNDFSIVLACSTPSPSPYFNDSACYRAISLLSLRVLPPPPPPLPILMIWSVTNRFLNTPYVFYRHSPPPSSRISITRPATKRFLYCPCVLYIPIPPSSSLPHPPHSPISNIVNTIGKTTFP